MTNEKLKAWTEALKELSENYEDLAQAMQDITKEMKRTKKLWRTKNKSTLVKVGLALIAFPDPTISDIVGTALVAAGTVQAGIRRRTIFMEDIPKTFQNTLKEVWNTRENL